MANSNPTTKAKNDRAVEWDDNRVAARLAVLRRYLGHTPESFAELLGFTARTYRAYEAGQRPTGHWTRMLPALAHIDVSLDWLLGGIFAKPLHNDRRPTFIGTARPPVLRVIDGGAA